MLLRVLVAVFLSAIIAGVPALSAPQIAQPAAQIPMNGMSARQSSGTTAQVAGPLTIAFADKSAQWTPGKLASLPHLTITVWNEHAKANQTYSGVPLADLLTGLGVPDKPRGKDFLLYIVAEGSDGYRVVYSLGEVEPDVHDATIIVADSENGKPLTGSGPFQLVATGEKRPARWVHNLVAIHVRTAD